MLKSTITLTDAVTILTNVVKDHGADHAPLGNKGAPGCNYTTAGLNHDNMDDNPTKRLVPVCIVGQVFAYLGILRAVFQATGSEFSTCGLGSTIWVNAETMGVTFTKDAQVFLRSAQQEQDSGRAWGVALTTAFAEAQERALTTFKRESGLFTHLDADVKFALGQ